MQDALSIKWKSKFPELKMLQYRILSAVPSSMVIQDKILSDRDAAVRWNHQAGSSAAGNGSVCYNYVDPCFNDPTRMNDPAFNCSFPIRAAAYNWSNPLLADWFLDNVIKTAMVHGDGVWLDGIGPDNGAYLCAGLCCGYDASNSPLLQSEIESHCDGMTAATTQAQKWLIANGGWEAMKCSDFMSVETGPNVKLSAVAQTSPNQDYPALPNVNNTPSECAARLVNCSNWGSDHSNYNYAVAYGGRTGGRTDYDDESAAGTVAAFLLMRGQHWLFSIGPNGGAKPAHPQDPHDPGTLLPETARLFLSDYGKPKGSMVAVQGKKYVFQREYEKATITLDCNSWEPTFEEHF